MDFQSFLNKFSGVTSSGDEYKGICPAHDDNKASLSISYDRSSDKILLYCHAGCRIENIISSVGLSLRDLYCNDKVEFKKGALNKIVSEYFYKDRSGNTIFIKVRYDPKSFSQKRIIGDDTIWGLDEGDYYETFPGSRNYSKKKKNGAKYKHFSGAKPVLYNLPMLIETILKGEQVFIVEGEKDVENLKKIGLTATCNFDGASQDTEKSKWRNEYNELFKEADIVIIPDNDNPGRAHSRNIAKALYGIAASIKIVDLPGLKDKQDVSDWLLLTSNNKEKLIDLIATTPKFTKYNLSYDFNDYGNGKRLVDRHGELIRYCNEWESWLFFNDGYWERDNNGTLQRMAKSIIEDIRNEALNTTDDENKKRLLKHVLRSGSVKGIRGMVEAASTEKEIRISSKEFDTNTMLLNCKNGTLNLITGEFTKPSPRNYITKQINVEYMPNQDCPRWKTFMNEIMLGNKELVGFIQRAIGYSLTGSVKEEKMFILYGSGANGKSKLLEVLRLLLNDYARNIQAESLLKRDNKSLANTDIARLKGARLATAKEIEEGRKLDEALIKEAVGGDMLTARFLYQNEFEFMPEFKLWLATNHKPEITGSDDGIWRRIILIPFEAHFTKENGTRDDNLLEKLKSEIPGILNWCLEGCLKWQKEGLNPPKEILAATEEYRQDTDNIQQFINECCVINSNAYIENNRLVSIYNEWSGENINPTKFGLKFKGKASTLGLKKDRKAYGVFWYGIGEALKNANNIGHV